LEAERANLLAAIPQAVAAAPGIPAELTRELTRALFGFFEVRGYWQDGVQANQTVVELARRTRDRTAQAQAQNDLAYLYERRGRYPEAIACQQDSLIIRRELGDRHGEAEALRDLGDALRATGRNSEAEAGWREALTICEALEIPEADEIRERLATLPNPPGSG